MMKEIYIFGLGGFAREVFYLIKDLNCFDVKAFIDRKPVVSCISIYNESIPVISEDNFLKICTTQKKIDVVIAIANSLIVSNIISRFRILCEFPNLIHPSVKIFGVLKMGVGNVIAYNCLFSDNVTIGSFNRFNIGNIIGHDVEIGDNNHFNPSCNISGNVKIGDDNLIGVKAVILQGIKLGNGNTVGASSLLFKNIKDDSTYIGVPAKKMDYK